MVGLTGCEESVGYVVQKGPAIEANTKKIDFGAVDVGTQAFMELDLSNIGESLLQISEVFVQPAGTVFGYMGETDFNLQLNRSRVLQLYFWPVEVQAYSATLEIYSDAENFPIYTIELVGEGQEWSLCGSCDNPPENECLPGGYLLVYEQNGTCDDTAECRYAANVVPCAETCLDGVCVGDGGILWPEEPDAGTAPPSTATDAGTEAPLPPVIDAGNSAPCPSGDTDNDGICDDVDNCVNDPNTNQADGDTDGIGDVCDACPALPNGEGTDADDDGIDDSCGGDHCYEGMSDWSPATYPVASGALTRADPAGNDQWVVEDSRTGRTWLSCLYNTADGTGCEDIDPYDDWDPSTENDYLDWNSQWIRCDELEWAGHSDWTVPSIDELQTLNDFAPDNFPVDSTMFPNLVNPEGTNALVWSRSPYPGSSTQFFSYSFASGYVGYHNQTADIGVLCVRKTNPSSRCFDLETSNIADENIILDHTAGLMWQEGIWAMSNNSWGLNHTYGGIYPSPVTSPCNASYGGHNDWRLPTVSELGGLVIYGTENPAWPDVFGSAGYGQTFWSATRKADSVSSYWVVDFTDGDVKTLANDANAKVKCVRDNVD
ncbi:MAG: hypothetical protein CMH56_06030 [Myxococcales bacterium]|nr:hypothetical protein [Myxococcales bacterium]